MVKVTNNGTWKSLYFKSWAHQLFLYSIQGGVAHNKNCSFIPGYFVVVVLFIRFFIFTSRLSSIPLHFYPNIELLLFYKQNSWSDKIQFTSLVSFSCCNKLPDFIRTSSVSLTNCMSHVAHRRGLSPIFEI